MRGAPIARHERSGGLRFDPQPPYEVIETDAMTRADLQAVRLLARFHGMIVNSGRMPRLAARCIAEQPFARLMALSGHLFSQFGRAHSIGLEALFDAVLDWLRQDPTQDPARLEQEALADYRACGARGRLAFMATGLSGASGGAGTPRAPARATPTRQTRHLQNVVEAHAAAGRRCGSERAITWDRSMQSRLDA